MQRCFYRGGVFAASLILFAGGSVAAAHADQEEWLGSLRLRGGYDTNPTLNPLVPGASAFAGIDAAFAGARSNAEYAAGIAVETSYTRLRDPGVAPVQRHTARFNLANQEQNDLSIKATTSAEHFSNYDTRSFDARQRLRLQWMGGAVRPFVSAELRYSALNESNPIGGGFFPEPQRFLRGIAIPGIAFKQDALEIGASVNLSATRYDEEFDFFGFRRDNERVQPFVFVRYQKSALSLFAALSRLFGDWQDADFSDVRRTMFELSVEYQSDPVSLEFSVTREAGETTFPLSPISIDTEISARATLKLGSEMSLAMFGRYLEREFLDSPFRSRTASYGIELERELADDLSLGLEVAHLRASPILGPAARGIVTFASVTKRFGSRAGIGDPASLLNRPPPLAGGQERRRRSDDQ